MGNNYLSYVPAALRILAVICAIIYIIVMIIGAVALYDTGASGSVIVAAVFGDLLRAAAIVLIPFALADFLDDIRMIRISMQEAPILRTITKKK